MPTRPSSLPPPGDRRGAEWPALEAWQATAASADILWASHAEAGALAQRARWRLQQLLAAACGAPLHARRLRAALGPGAGDPARSPAAAYRAAALPLEAIEPIDRAAASAGFDESCTDRRVTREALAPFLADPGRIGEAFLGRYAVWTSSGSTGEPAIWVHDARALAVYDALETLRFGGLDRPGAGARAMREWLASGPAGARRFAMVGATGGHFAGTASVERLRRGAPWARDNVRTFTILQSVPALAAELEAFDPAIVATYPTAAEVLAAEHEAGRLRVRPSEIWLGGEQLVEPVRRRIAAAFGCPVRQAYGASECLSIAWECALGTLHLNADWAVLEPVDRAMRPVPPGEPSHTVLLTNLANHVQPVLRHDLGDGVTLTGERCACGSAMPAMRIEGRRDDVIELDGPRGAVRLMPLAVETVLEHEAGARAFQLVATDRRTLSLRLAPGPDATALRARCGRALRRFLDDQGLPTIRIVDDPVPPMRDPRSGKLRHVLRAR